MIIRITPPLCINLFALEKCLPDAEMYFSSILDPNFIFRDTIDQKIILRFSKKEKDGYTEIASDLTEWWESS